MLEPKILVIGAPARGSPLSGLKANEKGSQHVWPAETLFLCALNRRIYKRSLTAADSRSMLMLTFRLYTLGAGTSWHNRPWNSWTWLTLSVLFSHRVNQILNGADHGQSQDPKDRKLNDPFCYSHDFNPFPLLSDAVSSTRSRRYPLDRRDSKGCLQSSTN